MGDLPPDVAELLTLARRAQGEPDVVLRERVRRGVASAVVAGVVVGAASKAGAQLAAKSAISASLAVKIAGGALACAVAVGAVAMPRLVQDAPRLASPAAPHAMSVRSPSRVIPEVERTPSEGVVAPPSSEAAAEPSTAAPERPRASRAVHVRPARDRMAPHQAPPTLHAELRLLEQAEHAIEHAAPAHALELLARHRADFPTSAFGEEREGLMLLARCTIDRAATSVDVMRFLAEHKGVLNARIEAACGAMP